MLTIWGLWVKVLFVKNNDLNNQNNQQIFYQAKCATISSMFAIYIEVLYSTHIHIRFIYIYICTLIIVSNLNTKISTN